MDDPAVSSGGGWDSDPPPAGGHSLHVPAPFTTAEADSSLQVLPLACGLRLQQVAATTFNSHFKLQTVSTQQTMNSMKMLFFFPNQAVVKYVKRLLIFFFHAYFPFTTKCHFHIPGKSLERDRR